MEGQKGSERVMGIGGSQAVVESPEGLEGIR